MVVKVKISNLSLIKALVLISAICLNHASRDKRIRQSFSYATSVILTILIQRATKDSEYGRNQSQSRLFLSLT